jgi:hypothetical protein
MVAPVTEAQSEASYTATTQSKKILSSTTNKTWGDRTFRFKLSSLRLDDNISIRRFSIVEAALYQIRLSRVQRRPPMEGGSAPNTFRMSL